jgi:diguanylate cyclase (GGDEF)-like protein
MSATQARPIRLDEELRALFERSRLPTSPAIAAQVLHLIDDPDSTATQFARVIQSDPALAVRLLRLANSARYAQRVPVNTIQRAVAVVGLRQLRVTVLGFELVSHVNRIGSIAFDLRQFWQRSVLRACLAREVARMAAAEVADEAFLVGLLQDCGMVVLAQILGPEYAQRCAQEGETHSDFYAWERVECRCDHASAAAALASIWRLPQAIGDALASHHQPELLEPQGRAADRLQAVSCAVAGLAFRGREVTIDEPMKLFAEHVLELDAAALHQCLQRGAECYREVAEVFDDEPGRFDVAELLQEANRQLQEQAAAAEDRVRDVEAERDQILDEQLTLRKALGQYRTQAARDPLTGLLNRRALLDATVYCLRRAEHVPTTIAVFFIDLDDFKKINDTCGHQVGDRVLVAVAERARQVDVESAFASRYGGEEFVVVLTGINEAQARQAADDLLRHIRAMRIEGVGHPVTCSLGAVWGHLPRALSPEALFEAADQLMYLAKRGGKDRVCFRALPSTGAAPVAVERPAPGPAAPAGRARTSIDRLRQLADRLNGMAGCEDPEGRKQARQPLAVPCSIHFMTGPHRPLEAESAFVRNVSAGGIGLLTSAGVHRGDLVEIAFELPDTKLFLVGIVAFNRPVADQICEIGVQLYQHAEEPILSKVGCGSPFEVDWVTVLLGGASHALPVRRSA